MTSAISVSRQQLVMDPCVTTISWSGPDDYHSWQQPNHWPDSATATAPRAANAEAVHMAAVCQEMHQPAVHNLCMLQVKKCSLKQFAQQFRSRLQVIWFTNLQPLRHQ